MWPAAQTSLRLTASLPQGRRGGHLLVVWPQTWVLPCPRLGVHLAVRLHLRTGVGSGGLLCGSRGGARSGCTRVAQLPRHIKESGERATLSHVTFAFLGWTSRTQFEETWATLLGVLVTQPLVMEQEESPPEVRLRAGPPVHWPAAGQSRQLVTCSWGAREGQQARCFGLPLCLPG